MKNKKNNIMNKIIKNIRNIKIKNHRMYSNKMNK